MNDDNLRKLIECEKRSKEEVEIARKEILKSRIKAREDCLEEINEMKIEQERKLKVIEDDIDLEISNEKKKINTELSKNLKKLKESITDVDKLVDYIVKGISNIE